MLLRCCYHFQLIVIVLSLKRTFVSGTSCDCKCENNHSVCKLVKDLNSLVEASANQWIKWNESLGFLERWRRNWKTDVKQIAETELNNKLTNVLALAENSGDISKNISALEEQKAELETKISGLEAKLQTVEHRTGEVESDLQIEKNARIDFESKIAGFEAQLQDALRETMRLEAHLKKEIEARIATEEEMLGNFSRLISTTEKQNLELQRKISIAEAKLQTSEELTQKLETDLQREIQSRRSFEGQHFVNYTGIISTTEKQNQKLQDLQTNISAVETELQSSKDETKMLESEIEREKETRKDFQEELENLSTTITAVAKENLDLQLIVSGVAAKLDTTEDQTKKLESGLETEVEAIKALKEELLANFSRAVSTIQQQNVELQRNLSGVHERLFATEDQSRVLESDLETEINARKVFQEELLANFSTAVSTIQQQNVELQRNLSGVHERLFATEDQSRALESDLETEINARKVFQEKLRGDVTRFIFTTENSIKGLNGNIYGIRENLRGIVSRTKKIESNLTKEVSARKKLKEEIVRNISGTLSTIQEKDVELQTHIFDVETKVHIMQNTTKHLESAVKTEKDAREMLENAFIDMKNQTMDTYAQISGLEEKANVTDALAKKLESDLQEEIEARNLFENDYKEQQLLLEIEDELLRESIAKEAEERIKLEEDLKSITNSSKIEYGTASSRRIRALKRSVSSFGEELSAVENEAVPVGTEIPEIPNITRMRRNSKIR